MSSLNHSLIEIDGLEIFVVTESHERGASLTIAGKHVAISRQPVGSDNHMAFTEHVLSAQDLRKLGENLIALAAELEVTNA